MEDDSAEIELLEQNLNKTHQISKRMISILTGLDTRLMKLEKSILPLYTATQKLNQRSLNIDRALSKIDEVASSQEGIAVEEGLILRGPQPGQVEVYMDTLGRLNAAIAFKSSDADSWDTARLVETGAKKLTQLYTKLVAEGSSGSPPIAGLDFTPVMFPPSLLASLKPLVAFLRTLPVPSTHPSHPASQTILATLKEAQRGYADMRGTWNRKALETNAKRVVDRAETLDGVVAGKEFGAWVANLLRTAENILLLVDLAPLSSPSLLASTYDTLLTPLLQLFTDTNSSFTSLVKRSLHKYTFHALSTYSALASSQVQWEALLARRGEGRKDANELRDGTNAIRGVCLRSFPEFLADLKLAATGSGKGGELGVGLADFVVSAVQYLDKLPEVERAVGSALHALGDGNWKMGDGKQVGKGQRATVGEVSETVLIQHYVYDVITTTISSVTAVSRTQRRGAFGSVFLLNNITYFHTRVLLKPAHSGLAEYLSKPTTDALASAFRTAKAGYFEANYSPLMQALSEDREKEKVGSSAWKAATKEKFTRFYDLLEEVGERHRMAKVLEEDEEARKAVGEEAVKLVVPSLQRFTQKQREKEFSKNIKLSAEEVEKQIRSFYK
ncbi:Cullin repeat-like-containing domain protein [Pisolithus orientalis]|uniref:Cullin repeat-like-containing domain protein n=1 Tax=Pisolithus orientalis TaxID=936130 RepID=UPI00222452A3|nr:Cullin repeat-like-containing domain protein [Pisolithus orientalis]KAI6028869.1 Cullin repeat-like-containing domain protein [Pisolithus orientalis]